MTWTVGEVARVCNGQIDGCETTRLRGLSTDSRRMQPGSLFVAIIGDRYDGHEFIEAAVSKGARAAIVSRTTAPDLGIPTVRVEDTVVALGELARTRRARFHGPVIAITGSNGKTTTKEMCAAILTAAGLNVRRTPGNLNNQIGLPLSILGLEAEDDVLVVELGMNRAGEIDKLARIASPDIGIITQIAPAHIGPLGSIEAIARAKGELFDHIRPDGIALINLDDPNVRKEARRFAGRQSSFAFHAEADLQAQIERQSASGADLVLRTPAGDARVHLDLPGTHMAENALCATAAACATERLGHDPVHAIEQGLRELPRLPGRMHLRKSGAALRILDDSYNANPHSVAAALRTLKDLAGSDLAVLVLGDMLELGEHGKALHESIGSLAAQLGLQCVIGMGPLAAWAAQAARKAGVPHAYILDDPQSAARKVRDCLRGPAIVLVKGSRGMRMELVVRALEAT